MKAKSGVPREVALPVTVFEALRAEVENGAGTLETVRAMHHAGYTAGLSAAFMINREAGGDAFALASEPFWRLLSNYFSTRGWGTLEHRAAHPGIGVLSSGDWAESSAGAGSEAGCSVSAGLLSGILSQLAGDAVAVLEVRCRSRGHDACDFAFGSETAVHELYGRMLDGADIEHALQAL